MKELKFTLDFRSDTPGYVQIVEQVEAFLTRGELEPGDQLPTVRQLASELRINFNTIARAYRLLDDAGVISTQRGRGTYILERPSEEAMQKIKLETLESQIKNFLRSLERQGFTPKDTENTFSTLFQNWNKGLLEKETDEESQ